MAQASKWINAKGDAPVTEVAAQSLRSRLKPVQRYLPLAATKYEKDIEYVHQLRVATRRAQAAIEMYRELLPEWRAAWLEKQLSRIRKATNDARDDDVFAQRLADDDAPAAARLLKRVREHRAGAQKPALKVYERMTKKQGRLDRRMQQLLKRVRLRGKRRKSEEPSYRAWAEEHLRPILEEFFEMAEGDLKDIASLHQFRIAGKKLRYAMELLSAAFCSELRKNAYPLLETLQDHLGKVNDRASALVRIQRWIAESEDSEKAVYLRTMLESGHAELDEACRCFSAWWTTQRRNQMRDAFDQTLGGGRNSATD